jgi:hypothetical protein
MWDLLTAMTTAEPSCEFREYHIVTTQALNWSSNHQQMKKLI